MLALQSLTPNAIHAHFPDIPLPEARKAVATVHRDEALVPRQGLRRTTVQTLLEHGHVPSLSSALLSSRSARP